MNRKPSRGEVSRRAGRATARSTLPQRCLSPPTRKNSRAEMTPWAMLANSAACRPVSDAGGQGEGDEPHVRHRRVGDQPLEVALDEADQRPPDDADDAGDGEHRREPAEAVGHGGDRQPHQAVGAHLQQHGGQQHRPGGRARWCGPAAARCAPGRPAPSPTARATSSAATSSCRSAGRAAPAPAASGPQVGGAAPR